MAIPSNPPDAIRRIHGRGFVDYTITQRLPKILSDIAAPLNSREKLAAAHALLQAITTGNYIDTNIFSRPTIYWEEYLNKLDGTTWNDLPFFDLEFLFYHGVNSIAGYFDSGVDVFQPTRKAALNDALPAVESSLEKISALSAIDLLHAVIHCALFANEADYSQLITTQSESQQRRDRILIDETAELIDCLKNMPDQTATLHLIADNAGPELCWDLVMVDAILECFGSINIVLHVKPWPMFVSDALRDDVEGTIHRFINKGLSDQISLIGKRLENAIQADRLQIQDENDWGEPRHFNALDASLTSALCDAIAVISKGDLNYRRFVQDRQWPAETPAPLATAGVPFKAFALRVLKSDAVVGVKPSIVCKASAERRDWRTCGHFAVVQRLP